MKKASASQNLPPAESEQFLQTLQTRFAKYPGRHPGLEWAEVESRLKANPAKLRSLLQMEATGGEPDAVVFDPASSELLFVDCSPESPKGRVSICYDREALDSRKEHKPQTSALELAAEMGIELLTEEQYRELQKLGKFDTKTSSWLLSPAPLRKLGGALFGDRRYDRVFIYHNGAQSYYSARGFRGWLQV